MQGRAMLGVGTDVQHNLITVFVRLNDALFCRLRYSSGTAVLQQCYYSVTKESQKSHNGITIVV
jgi:hypothetical protein